MTTKAQINELRAALDKASAGIYEAVMCAHEQDGLDLREAFERVTEQVARTTWVFLSLGVHPDLCPTTTPEAQP